jgi:hypothetical protein
LGLPSPREEHSVDPDGEKGHPGGFPDVSVRAAEDLGRRRSDADRMNLAAWDAWGAVRRDALADGYLELPLLGADAEKLAVLELACRELDGWTSVEWVVPAEVPLLWAAVQRALAALDTRVVAQSAAQSCVARVVAAGLAALVLWAAELALECSAPDFVRQASQNSLLEPKECGLPEEPELKLEEL